jgi:hypothetical protein
MTARRAVYPVGVLSRHTRRWGATRLAATLAVAAVAGTGTAPAGALEGGVHVDPGSPAAKEYALPLTQARHTGSPRGGLFGAGIRRAAAAGAAKPTHGASTHDSAKALSAARGGRATPAERSRIARLPAAVRSAVRAGEGGDSGSILALAAGGVVVLALGALGGTVVRGRRTTGSA